MNTNDHNLTAWLTLTHAHTIGIRTIQKCLRYFTSVTDLCAADDSILSQIGLSQEQIIQIKQPNKRLIEQALSWQQTDNSHHIITFSDLRYPALLKEIGQPPTLLYVVGDPHYLLQPQLAIVGSRNPSHNGLEFANSFAYQLAEIGFTITSGLALGVDGAAHRGALAAKGNTIAVLGTGLNQIYPKRHRALTEQIVQSGCLVSEFSLDSQPIPTNFPRRNRIISGLSLGTLVIEAATKSGSLITARYAAEQNREVFALPGSLKNPAAQGCLQLIQQGAKCVTNIDDILQEINQLSFIPRNPSSALNFKTPPSYESQVLESDLERILASVDHDNMTTIDQICERSKLASQTVVANLLTLELTGHVIAHQGGYIKR